MLIIGTEGYLPLQKKTIPVAGPAGAGQIRQDSGRFDSYSLSPGDSSGFRDAVASLAYQVRTANTTGKIQELRSQVQSGRYQISPREVAARMMLMETED